MEKDLEQKLYPSSERTETKPKIQTDNISDVPAFPINFKELTKILVIILKSALPSSVGHLWNLIAGIISMRFVARYGSPSELAGVTFASTWSGVFCVSIISSIIQGFGVIGSQLVGAKKYTEFGLLLQKNLFVLGLFLIPLLAPYFFADSLLIWLGLDYEVSINAGIYLKSIIPGVIALTVYESLRTYLVAQNFFYIQPIVKTTFTGVHVFLCYIFVVLLKMPVAGVALAKSISDTGSAITLWLYIKFSGKFQESWISWNISCTEKWVSYLKQTLTIGANLYIEWIALEGSMFLISALNDEYLVGAHGLAILTVSLFYIVPASNSASTQIFIGNAVGEGSKNKAQKFMITGLAFNIFITLVNVLVMILLAEELTAFFTEYERTKEAMKTIIYIYSVGHIADNFVNFLTGILKTVGNEKQVFKCFCITYLAIGLNSQWIFGLALGYGYVAIWIGLISSMYLMCGWGVWKVIYLDWDFEVARILNKIHEIKIEDNRVYIELSEKC